MPIRNKHLKPKGRAPHRRSAEYAKEDRRLQAPPPSTRKAATRTDPAPPAAAVPPASQPARPTKRPLPWSTWPQVHPPLIHPDRKLPTLGPQVRDVPIKDIPHFPLPPLPEITQPVWTVRVFYLWNNVNARSSNPIELPGHGLWYFIASRVLTNTFLELPAFVRMDLLDYLNCTELKALLCRRAGLPRLLPDQKFASTKPMQAGLIASYLYGVAESTRCLNTADLWIGKLLRPLLPFFVEHVIAHVIESPTLTLSPHEIAQLRHAAREARTRV